MTYTFHARLIRTALLALFLAPLAVTVTAQRTDTLSTASKLTTVLADLAQAVAQEGTPATLQSRAARADVSGDAMPQSVRDALRTGRLRVDADNAAQVYILLTDVTDQTLRQLTDAGAVIEIGDASRRRVQARVPVGRLQQVAQLSIVDAIRLPTYARGRTGTTITQGDDILYSVNVRSQLTLDGSGVRVGVVSDGLKGVFATGCTSSCGGADGGPIASGDLPGAVGVRNAGGVLTSSTGGIVGKSFRSNGDLEGLPPASSTCAFAGAGAEGTALLEIVHDLAPSAKLSFANADTDLAFMQAVNFLAASNDVVVDDIGFYGEPYDGTSAVSRNTAAALNNTAYPIRAYFTSVGNDADEHYYGAYADSGVDGTTIGGLTTPGRLHLFQRTTETTDVLGLGSQPYNVIALPQNGEVAIFLTWDDAFGSSGNNYDLFLVQQSTGRVVASSTDVQSGRQDPSETIDYVNRGAQDFFRIVVQNVRDAAQPKNLNLFSFQPECASAGPQRLAPPRHERYNYTTAARSVSAQSDAGGSPAAVMSVGAICSASADAAAASPANAPNASCLDTSNRTAEFFSSRGPTLDGRIKPDIAAIDGVAISGAGSFGRVFFGTSAASPHMGGLTALLLQGAPCLLSRSGATVDAASARTRVRDLLLGRATALGDARPDNVFGAGRADAFASVHATLPAWTGTRTTMTVDGNTSLGASVTAEQLGFLDPNQCGLKNMTWSGGCGSGPAAQMTCPFGTTTVSVSASNNLVAFSDPTELTITVTDYAIGVLPDAATVEAGGSGSFLVTLAGVGGPFNSEVTLSCAAGNMPPGTTCAFDPPIVVPRGGQAQSRLTISTTAATVASSASRPSLSPRGVSPLAAGSNIGLAPASLAFTSQVVSTTSAAQTVTMANTGTDVLALSSILATGEFSQVNNCGTSLAVGATCSILVSFTPTAAGARTGSLSIVDDAPGSPHTIGLSGTGTATPAATDGTPVGSYTITIGGGAGTLTHLSTVTLVVQ